MSEVSSQRAAMDVFIAYLTDTKAYVDDVSQPTPDFNSYVEDLDTTELEAYLLNKMSSVPSFIESAMQEVMNFRSSWDRDNAVRRMSRADYFSDASESILNDTKYLEGLKEIQTAYIQGKTPQQRN